MKNYQNQLAGLIAIMVVGMAICMTVFDMIPE
jgi:hypothetical protein